MASASIFADKACQGGPKPGRPRLIAWLSVFAVGMAVTSASVAAPKIDCARMVAQVTGGKVDAGAIETAQRQLTAMKFDPQKIDGKLGPLTKVSLQQFCDGAKYAVSGDLLAMLHNHSVIARAYPNWVATFDSRGFTSWAEQQADAKAIAEIRAAGDSTKAIWVLDRYRQYKSFVPTVRTADEALYSYALIDDDFKQMKSTDGLLKRIGQLRGKPFVNQDDFDAALEAAFKGVVQPERFIRLVQKYAEPEAALMLSEKSIDALKAKGVPPYVLKAIQPLQGLTYGDGEMEDALSGVLNPLAEKIAAMEAQIAKLAELSPTGARITARSRAKFAEANKDDLVADALVDRLSLLEVVEYQNDKAMSKALKNALQQEVERMNKLIPDIVAAAEDVTSYSLSEDALGEIKDELSKFLIPDIYLELIADLKGADYSDPDLLWAAAKNRVAISTPNNPVRRGIFGQIEKHASSEIDQSLLDTLKGEISPAMADFVGGLMGRKFEDTQALEGEIDRMFKQLSDRFEAYKPIVLAQAWKRHAFSDSKPIRWSGESCNCVRENLAGEVYGFYPVWAAGEKQNIDFSVTTRIGYYALSFDDKGNLPEAARWRDMDAEVINEVRRYGTRLDVVIRRGEWEAWNRSSPAERAEAFDLLATNIAGLLSIPLDNFSSRAEPYISLGLSPHPVRGDGVTLDFRNYAQDAESVGLFMTFVHNLGEKLRQLNRPMAINFVIRNPEFGTGIFEYSKMLAILDEVHGKDNGLESLFLVLLQEPTTDGKKALRAQIENNLHGRDRMKLLRRVAMVITYAGNERQLVDDIIYANDNFGGIGFWTQPFVTEGAPGEGVIAKALHRNFVKTDQGFVQNGLSVCRFICPNKWAFRTAFDLFALALLISGALYFSLCAYRALFDKYFLYFLAGIVAPFILIGIALLACDPGWAAVSRGNGLLVLVVAGVIAYAIWNYFERKRQAELP